MPDEVKLLTVEEVDALSKQVAQTKHTFRQTAFDGDAPDDLREIAKAGVSYQETAEHIIADWRRMNTALQKIVEGPCCRMPNCRPDDPACNKAIAREAVGKAG